MLASTAMTTADHAAPASPLLLSPLNAEHRRLGARMAEFSGWEMPLHYSGVVEEHASVRSDVGVFDVSHLGTGAVRGPGARALLDRSLTNALGRIGPGQAQYTLCLDEQAGVVDDLIVYLRSDDDLLLVPNAANAAGVFDRLRAAAPAGVQVLDLHQAYAVLAVQGPRSTDVLTALGLAVPERYMAFRDSGDVTVCRTGYTGELGYELVAPASRAPELWAAILAAGARPCGLGARDTLRTEMGYALHGHELSGEISPLEAGVGWAVGWDKPTFWGRDALARQRAEGPARRLRGLVASQRAVPRPGMTVLRGDDVLGTVTSGTFSPTLNVGIALALLLPAIEIGAEVQLDVRGRRVPMQVVDLPFVARSPR